MKKILFVSLFSLGCILPACKKNGPGGKTKVIVSLQHHGNVIKNHFTYPDTVFVKFKASDLPGLDVKDYDAYFTGVEGEDHVDLGSLRPGKYYLYGVGMDSTGPYRVRGGLAIVVGKTAKKKELSIALPVTE